MKPLASSFGRHLGHGETTGRRYRAHHLADDLLAVEAVDGFAALLKRMLEDAEAYEDLFGRAFVMISRGGQ